jgi:hypothetical protein
MSEFSYAKLTEPQRWQWHAGVYAFRRSVLGVPAAEHTSPCDPKGEWFDQHAVASAEAALRGRIAEQSQRCAADTATRNAIRMAAAALWREQRYEAAE